LITSPPGTRPSASHFSPQLPFRRQQPRICH
jgi:hypothetical protein